MYDNLIKRFDEIDTILKNNRMIDSKVTYEIGSISRALLSNKTEFDKLSSEKKELVKRRANF